MLPERTLKIFGLKGTLHGTQDAKKVHLYPSTYSLVINIQPTFPGDLLKGKLCYSTIEPDSQDQVFRFNSRDTHGETL